MDQAEVEAIPESPNWFCEHSHSCDITWCSSVRTTGIAYLHTRCCFSAEHTTLGCSIIVTNLSLWTLCSFTLAKSYISPQTQSFPKPYQSTWFSVIKSNQLVKAKVKSNWKQHKYWTFCRSPKHYKHPPSSRIALTPMASDKMMLHYSPQLRAHWHWKEGPSAGW